MCDLCFIMTPQYAVTRIYMHTVMIYLVER
jgi:hypothetical protein